MEVIGSILLILALGLFTAVFVARPFLSRTRATSPAARQAQQQAHQLEHQHSSLLAERDRTLNALQELDFDYALGKVPEEEYPAMRAELMTKGASVLRALDAFETSELGLPARVSAEERLEQAVAARRADAVSRQTRSERVREEVALEAAGGPGGAVKAARKPDPVEDMIASRKRSREESAAGFCPGCGKPVQKSDKFCSKCGRTL